MRGHWLGAAPNELIAVLAAIGDATATTPNGHSRPRYSAEGVAGLRRLVVAWNINPRLLDLAYLVTAVEQSGEDAVGFFLSAHRSFAGRDDFRSAMEQTCRQSPHAMEQRGLLSRYADRERVVWWNRDILILPPLFELLLVIDDVVIRDCAALRRTSLATEVAETATRWQNRLYAWLKELVGADDHAAPLGPLTQQRARHFARLAKWLRQRRGGTNAPLAELLTDDALLEFWLGQQGVIEDVESVTANAPELQGYRAFEHVAEVAFHFCNAARVGADRQATPADVDDADRVAVPAANFDDDHMSPLQRLAAPPLAAVKFLKDTEHRLLEPLLDAGPAAHQLPLTVLRAQTFGPRQRQLGRAAPANRAVLLAFEDVPSYSVWLAHMEQAQTRLQTLRDACLHTLLHLRSTVAVARVREALPELACWEAIEVSLPAAAGERDWANEAQLLEDYADAFFRQLPAERLRSQPLAAFLKRLAAAYAQVNTRGFATLPAADTPIGGSSAADVFAAGDECLGDVVAAIDGFFATLRQRAGGVAGLERDFRSDASLFRKAYQQLYHHRRERR